MGLSLKDLARLENLGVQIPQYDPAKITAGVVHIGPSNFARGHLFKYFDDILAKDSRWGVRAISIKARRERKPLLRLASEFAKQALPISFNSQSASLGFQMPSLPSFYNQTRQEVLAKQNNLYSVNEQSADGISRRIIGSLMDITVAQENPEGALDVLCDPQIKLVTITVTQDGYDHDDKTDEPSTTVDYIVAALERRMREGSPALTVMSCDNMPDNGVILRNAVLTAAAKKSNALRTYIEDNIKFPSTMVDRIVPTTTKANIFSCAAAGIDDMWPIMTERFMQWVIENKFAGDVPDFVSAGAIVTDNVAPYELMKLRMLNGSHMAMGCVAGLAGKIYVDEAMQDPKIREFIVGFMDEVLATVPEIEGVDFGEYKQDLIARLENPHIKDELVRLARNGTGKIEGRFLDPLRDSKANDMPHQHLAFATAAWIQYLKGVDEQGNSIDINDQKALELKLPEIASNSGDNPVPVMQASELFGRDLMRNNQFIDDVARHLRNIQEQGVIAALSEINQDAPSAVVALPKKRQPRREAV